MVIELKPASIEELVSFRALSQFGSRATSRNFHSTIMIGSRLIQSSNRDTRQTTDGGRAKFRERRCRTITIGRISLEERRFSHIIT